MRIDDPNSDNLGKLLDGLSLLDGQDQERVIRMVYTLEAADKNVKETIMGNPLKTEPISVYADDRR